MTGNDLVALTKQLLFENVAAVGSGLATDAEVLQVVASAHHQCWLWAVEKSPSYFAGRWETTIDVETALRVTTGSVPSNQLPAALPIDLSGSLVGEWVQIHKVLDVAVKEGDCWRPLTPGLTQDLATVGSGYPSHFYLEGGKVWIAPVPTQAPTVRLTYVAEIPPLAGAAHAFGGRLVPFHPLVAYEATVILCVKDDRDAKGFLFLRDQMRASMLSHLAKQQRNRGRMIREVPY